MGVRVEVIEGEPIDKALRRFKKRTQRAGIDAGLRRICYFVKLTEARRKKRFKKRFMARSQTLSDQMTGKQPVLSIGDAAMKFWRRRGKP